MKEESVEIKKIREENKARWLRESLTGKVAKKFKEIISPRGEHIILHFDPTTNRYYDEFDYKGRKLSAWAVYPYSEVGDYDIGPAVYCVGLGDLAVCPEFRQAVRAVEEEEGFRFQVAASIFLNDCLTIVGKAPVDFNEVIKRLNLKEKGEINKFMYNVREELSEILEPEFHLMFNEMDHKFFLADVHGIRQEDVIEHSPMFLEKVQRVAEALETAVWRKKE